MQVALVVTSAHELKGNPTGLWLEECAVPYYMFKDKGYEVVLVSPAGGPIPLDGNSLAGGFFVPDAKKFMHDGEAVGALSHTAKIEAVDWSSVDAMYMAGGHGTCVDFINNPPLKAAIETVYNAGKIVAADCHGPNALVDCQTKDGSPLVKDKVVTGFADSEEHAVKCAEVVPFLLESKFREQGGKYEKADADWGVKVCVDGNLITGQNPASSEACAKAVVTALSS